MSEACDIFLQKPDQFDHAVHGDDVIPALPSNSDLTFITKDDATESGRSMVVITWTCEKDGKIYRAQYSTSIRIIKAALHAIDAAYTDDGLPR